MRPMKLRFVVASAFSPEDRIGALEMQNLSVEDNRSFLVEHLRSLSKLPAGGEKPALAALLSEDEKL